MLFKVCLFGHGSYYHSEFALAKLFESSTKIVGERLYDSIVTGKFETFHIFCLNKKYFLQMQTIYTQYGVQIIGVITRGKLKDSKYNG